jgi:hypothetical protein
MKKLTATLLASSLLGLVAFAQGTVNFANLGVGLNQPILLNDGTTKVPSTGYTAELLAGTSAANLASVATTGFLSTAPGYFNGGVVTLAGITAGTAGFFEVRVFSTASGSFANAQTANALNTWGQSAVFSVTTGGAGAPPGPPASLTTLQGFNLNSGGVVPEPSSLALAGLGAAALLVFRRRK